jgi:hypothetical protein
VIAEMGTRLVSLPGVEVVDEAVTGAEVQLRHLEVVMVDDTWVVM